MIFELLLVSGGGAFGACARYLFSVASESVLGKSFPWGTLLVNSLGAITIGVLCTIFLSNDIAKNYRLFFSVGFLGAFTTFSAYSLETMTLFLDGKYKIGILNIVLNNGLALGLVAVGFLLARYLMLKQ